MIPNDALIVEYERLEALTAPLSGPGRLKTLGWDLEYAAPDTALAFVDQISFRRLNDFLPDNDTPVILDCGANVGYTVLHYKRLFPKARITAFEPDPQFLPMLRHNLVRNGIVDVRIVDAAAWTHDGHAAWVMEGKDGSRLVSGGGCGGAVVDVPTVNLASYLDGPIDLLKIDIEGAEYAVVLHIASRLANVKNILVECHILKQDHYRELATLLTTLQDSGFKIALNSYGPWRDLVRRTRPTGLHAEQYLLIAGWRQEPDGIAREQTWVPYVGVPHYKDLHRLAIELQSASAALTTLRGERDLLLAGHAQDLRTQRAQHDQELQSVRDQIRELEAALAGCAADQGPWRSFRLAGPFRQEFERCWLYELPADAPGGGTLTSPSVPTILFEDDRKIGPANSIHDDIRYSGAGRFSHWGASLYFSTFDNSDPNTNGRRYTLICRR